MDFNAELREMWFKKSQELAPLTGRKAAIEWAVVAESLVFGLAATIAASSGGDRDTVREMADATANCIADLCLEIVGEVEARHGKR